MTQADNHAQVAGSWWTSLAGWAYSIWSWFAGDATGMTILIGVTTIILTGIKIAQEIQAWRAKQAEHQVLSKLWTKMGRTTRPSKFE